MSAGRNLVPAWWPRILSQRVVRASLQYKAIGSGSWSLLAGSKICTACVLGEFGGRPAGRDEPAKHCLMIGRVELLADFFEVPAFGCRRGEVGLWCGRDEVVLLFNQLMWFWLGGERGEGLTGRVGECCR
jgi:hypothetical protein